MTFGKKASVAKNDPVKVLAKYDGFCVACGLDILEGEDWIIFSEYWDAFVHVECPI